MQTKIHIDSQGCIGCTLCTQIAPKTFVMKDDGKSHVLKENGDSPEQIEQAVESCPVDAMKLE